MTLNFPYGLTGFANIRERGLVYLDRTPFIRTVESLGDILVFLRPRRFGKSLWLDTLACYYDIRRADAFDGLFEDLEIGRDPTPLKNRYLVWSWDFSLIDAHGSIDQIAESLRKHIRDRTRRFQKQYGALLSQPIDTEDDTLSIIESLLLAVEDTGHRVYLLIDEYDNFINEVMTRDETVYRALLESDGPFKLLFKAVKAATQRDVERVFITGVSPVALNDISSGFNNAKDVTHDPALAGLCGFRAHEVSSLLTQIVEARGLSKDVCQDTMDIMRIWYNGYRFVQETAELMYNPTNTFYFLDYFARYGTSPPQLQDENLQMDRSKLELVTRQEASAGLISALNETGRSELPVTPRRSFSLRDLTEGLKEDERIVASFLFYLGLVTLTEDVPPYLTIPNLTVRRVFLERLLDLYIPKTRDRQAGRKAAERFFDNGDLQPLIDFLEQNFLPILSNRDRGYTAKRSELGGAGVNETVLKVLLLAFLFDGDRYYVFSEPEIGRGYADLCLIVRPELRAPHRFDVLFELKLVRRAALGLTGEALRNLSDNELRDLPPVKMAFEDAHSQMTRYADALQARFGSLLNLRAFAVVAVDLERILTEAHDPWTRPRSLP